MGPMTFLNERPLSWQRDPHGVQTWRRGQGLGFERGGCNPPPGIANAEVGRQGPGRARIRVLETLGVGEGRGREGEEPGDGVMMRAEETATVLSFPPRSPWAWDPAAPASLSGRGWHLRLQPPAL